MKNLTLRERAEAYHKAFPDWPSPKTDREDQVLPMFRKDTFNLVGAIGIVRSTNHRFRVAAIFKRQ